MKQNTPAEYFAAPFALMKEGYTDAFVLLYMRFERQCRRLFAWVARTHYGLRYSVIESFLATQKLGAANLIAYFDKLSRRGSFESIVVKHGGRSKPDYRRLKKQLLRGGISRDRGKIVHGLPTGRRLKDEDLAKYCGDLIDWMNGVAAGMVAVYGYDGMAPLNIKAKSKSPVNRIQISDQTTLLAFLNQKDRVSIQSNWLE